ncbi:MAG TPA: SRPBCC domain-containing protein [Terrimesophilobacter sp.]|nr:SRPBCC domain-containing protein [Terrimesophilobacter sp.]
MTPDFVELEFVRRFEFPPAIVFDALVDPDLIAGWLAHAFVGRTVGSPYDLVWLTSSSFPPTRGTITVFDEPQALAVETDNRGRFQFLLAASDGGPRGTSTILTTQVGVSVDPAFLPRVAADWQSSLDQLDALLRGHPVDWDNWDRDRSGAWREYLTAAGGR